MQDYKGQDYNIVKTKVYDETYWKMIKLMRTINDTVGGAEFDEDGEIISLIKKEDIVRIGFEMWCEKYELDGKSKEEQKQIVEMMIDRIEENEYE